MLLLTTDFIEILIACFVLGIFITLAKNLYTVLHKLFSNDKDNEIIPKLKDDEFLKLDDLILDKDVNKAIEENALTSVKSQKSKNNPEIK